MKRPVAVRCLHPRLRADAREVARALRLLDRHEGELAPRGTGPESGAISVAFLTDRELARLHGEFLADPAPTDVITFGGAPETGSAGEICVSADAARRQLPPARRRGGFAAELTLYLVHGWLHLAGHDDLAPGPRRAMRRAEARALEILRAAGAIPRFALRSAAR
jgi:probable rRNA maturation factor